MALELGALASPYVRARNLILIPESLSLLSD